MAPRPPVRRERNNDYSAVGTAGRRTGVTLPQGKLDENGLEEITGLFSSPTKASPVKQQTGATGVGANANANDGQDNSMCEEEASEGMMGMDSSGLTPTQTLSARRSLGAPALPPPPPRSASPRKSGISGTARRSNGIDILSPSKKGEQTPNAEEEDRENSPTPTPTPIRAKPMRFVPSLEKSGPLKEVVTNGAAVTAKHLRDGEKVGEKGVVEEGGTEQSEREEEVAGQVTRNGRQRSEPPSNRKEVDVNQDEDSVQNPMGDDEMEEFLSGIDKTIQNAAPLSGSPPKAATSRETEKVVESIEPVQPKTLPPQKSTSPRNNGRKRKSEEFEQDGPAAAPSSKKPAKKPRAPNKTEGPKAKSSKQKAAATPLFNQDFAPQPPSTGAQEPPPQSTSAAPNMRTLTTSDANAHLSLSHRQRAELDQIIEKVRSRPGKLKTLYVLKREKAKKASTGDDVRAGRAVVKPLAYWNAESCVHDDGDGAPALEVGARIPLGNVREVGAPPQQQKGDTSMEDDAGFGFGCDGHEEPWETDIGVFRGQANVWNPDPSNDEQEEMTEETDLAFHPSSMLTREVKGSGGFRFAKLVSTPFFGCGIVDLPPGGVKRPKNSRAMHMCFFVAKGRVTVRVGREIDPDVDVDGEGETFSIGRGGVFQVPRGNKYSIENVLDKPARIFFSQGCETVPEA